MPIFKPSELCQFLHSLNISPRKKLSQNFLIDGNIVKKICLFAQLHPRDSVLEIGPGPGALTEELLSAGARVIAIEKDPIFAKALQRLQTTDQSLAVIEGDFLDYDVLKHTPIGTKVIANLPYNITTPILAKLFPLYQHITTITTMVQKEVADRLTAQAGSKDYSSFSIFAQFYTDIKFGFIVSASCFYPRPKVDSAIIQFTLRQPPLTGDLAQRFFSMTRAAFQQRRKMLTSSLKKLYPQNQVAKAMAQLNISSKIRPEELSLDSFLRLFEIIDQNKGDITPQC